ncbi:MAG: HAMP domain-containing histidine kinase [Candidatus Eremiobacteraeota bacterium]|nr:HAMP domain-containing histidine kinase [Candidatus Eremiobacteraeota bacterium]
MASATNSRAADELVLSTAALAERLAGIVATRHVPLLALRLPELERVAWRSGLAAARKLERRTRRAFGELAGRALRAGDLVAHDAHSELFSVALAGTARHAGTIALPADCRTTLARMAGALETGLGVDVERGWTLVTNAAIDLGAAAQVALERGAREQQRYDFFAVVGHELRAPLSAIRGYLETVLEEPLDSASRRRFLQIAQSEALRMGRLVDGMFEISLLDRSLAPSEPPAPLGPALAAALAACDVARVRRAATIVVRGRADGVVRIAHDRLVQIFVNVVGNAIAHGRAGGRIEITVGRSKKALRIDVDDDGPGIPHDEREAVFELAYRARTAGAAGSGLGLALVRRLIERAGGAVCATDSPLGGTRITLRLV